MTNTGKKIETLVDIFDPTKLAFQNSSLTTGTVPVIPPQVGGVIAPAINHNRKVVSRQ